VCIGKAVRILTKRATLCHFFFGMGCPFFVGFCGATFEKLTVQTGGNPNEDRKPTTTISRAM
jgi:hypothetical protein